MGGARFIFKGQNFKTLDTWNRRRICCLFEEKNLIMKVISIYILILNYF